MSKCYIDIVYLTYRHIFWNLVSGSYFLRKFDFLRSLWILFILFSWIKDVLDSNLTKVCHYSLSINITFPCATLVQFAVCDKKIELKIVKLFYLLQELLFTIEIDSYQAYGWYLTSCSVCILYTVWIHWIKFTRKSLWEKVSFVIL